ncbi:MAG TPA: hypothetical protein VGE28_19805 [Pseudomonas sp.]
MPRSINTGSHCRALSDNLWHECHHAFELGVLSRIHQRLCSPFGGGHLARSTELKL